MTRRPLAFTLAALMLSGQAAACVAPPFIDDAGEVRVDAGNSYSVGRITGLTWVPVEIGGSPVAEGFDIWLTLSGDGTANGRSACNRFAGPVTLDAGTMAFGPLRATRMACAGPAMALERDFLAALTGVTGFAVTPDDMLELTRADGTVAMRLRP